MLSMRPWSLMQLLAAHHAGPAPASLSPHMHMLSCKRVGRRQLGHGDIQRRGSSIGIPAHNLPTASRACGLSTFGDCGTTPTAQHCGARCSM